MIRMIKLMSILKAKMKMNRILLFFFFVFSIASVQAKEENSGDLLDRYVKLSKENDSLKEACKNLEKTQKHKIDSVSAVVKKLEAKIKSDSLATLKKLKIVQDSVAMLKTGSSQKTKCENELSVLKITLESKDQTIASLNNTVKLKEEAIAQEKKNSEVRASKSYEKGKSDAKTMIENFYQSNSLDQVIAMSTKGSIERDLKLIDSKSSVYGKIQQASIYFQARELLSKKYNRTLVIEAQTKLKTVKGSKKVEEVVSLLDDYELINDGLFSAIDKINAIDAKESVKGMGENVQAKKYAKIFGVLSEYVFGYGLKAENYPYIYDIWFQILNKKQSNPDSSVKDLQLLLK